MASDRGAPVNAVARTIGFAIGFLSANIGWLLIGVSVGVATGFIVVTVA